MKRFLISLLCAATACWSLVSCNPDWLTPDENGNTPTEEDIYWDVVGHLVDSRDITPDYKGKTFTAIIGSPDNGDESVRVVSLNTLAAAVECFNALTDAGITETTSTKEWKNDAVGSLTWHLTGDDTSWATVDVNIPSVPGLHKIIYRSPDQGDVNGSVGDNGSAYYRFGDVIKLKRAEDNEEEYWICVRPSFGPEGKGDSHWISVSPLPKSDVWPYYEKDYKYGPFVASNRMEYGIPKHLGDETKWHQDLAELLFAIMYPETWKNNIDRYSTSTKIFDKPAGLEIFKDFHYKRVKYHNAAFWTNVQNQWKARDLVPFLFGISYDEMAAAINPNNANARGLHFLYEGSKWSISYSNKPTLYQVHYTNGAGDEEKNMHKETKKSVSSQVVIPRNFDESNTNYPFDVYKLSSARPYLSEARFFGDNAPRWIVRYKTGEELSSTGRFDPQQPIPGITANDEIYRYYKNVYPEKNLTDEPEVTDSSGGYGYVGKAHYKWGDVYKDEKGCKWFVLNQAGFESNSPEIYNEHMPYGELISFDTSGFETYTPAGKNAPTKVSNLPSLDIAIRAYTFLWLEYNQIASLTTDEELQGKENYGLTAWNIWHNAGVDLRTVLQSVRPQTGRDREDTYLTCIAYDSAGDNQALLRCVMNIQNERKDPKFYLWTKYPLNPDTQTQFVRDFRPRAIYLQDIADQQSVNALAPDTYAVQPFSVNTQPTSDQVTPRPIRAQADARANDVRNYFYNLDAFENLQYPGSMWNEPVLVFRYTRVLDRGDSDYSEKTVDGHKLTLFAERVWSSFTFPDPDDFYDYAKMYPMFLRKTLENSVFLNGEPYVVRKWDEIRDNEIVK